MHPTDYYFHTDAAASHCQFRTSTHTSQQEGCQLSPIAALRHSCRKCQANFCMWCRSVTPTLDNTAAARNHSNNLTHTHVWTCGKRPLLDTLRLLVGVAKREASHTQASLHSSSRGTVAARRQPRQPLPLSQRLLPNPCLLGSLASKELIPRCNGQDFPSLNNVLQPHHRCH